jgi:metal-dependent amidase/aminoacylase/carboxypeptidase family protein
VKGTLQEDFMMRRAQAIKEYLIELRHEIHQHPELGFEEFETTQLIKRELKDLQVKVVPLKLRTGLVGLLKGGIEGIGSVTALRADMDALPVTEKTGLLYASQKSGVTHIVLVTRCRLRRLQ